MKSSPSALACLLAGAALATADRDAHARAVRDTLDQRLEAAPAAPRGHLRRLEFPSDLHTDFSAFEGDWYRCLQTTLMTFNGDPADKHIVEQDACDRGQMGTISKVGNHSQTLMFDMFLLNHCWFHDLGGPDEPPCPDDMLASDSRGPGNVMVKYSFKGIGSFAQGGKIDFFADHTYLRDANGEWQPSHRRAKIEDQDQATCQEFKDGIVCDVRINEYRTGTKLHDHGCMLNNGKCKLRSWKGVIWDEARCDRVRDGGGNWTEDCAWIESFEDGFVYDDFGSYYLVKNISSCGDICPPTPAPAPPSPTPAPEVVVVWGCYGGGVCTGQHGCCDCGITQELCVGIGPGVPIWSSQCANICKP